MVALILRSAVVTVIFTPILFFFYLRHTGCKKNAANWLRFSVEVQN